MPAAGVEIEEGCTATLGGVVHVFTRLRVAPDARARLAIDERFCRHGIVKGGTLLDQVATERVWGAPVGRRPESWLAAEPPGTLAFCPTNWGWHEGCWFLDEGAWVGLPDDHPQGSLWMLGTDDAGWRAFSGEPDALRAAAPACGMEMPCIVEDGCPRPLHFLLSHARLRADFRNVFDFAAGRGPALPPEFWVLLRKLLPTEELAARIFLEGGAIELPLDNLASVDAERLARLVRAAELPAVQIHGDHLRVAGPLPKARLPVFGLGASEAGELIVVAVQGRSEEHPGATIEELARLLIDAGAVSGGLGSAGGDVAVAERTASGSRLRNRPSNRDRRTGEPVSRRVPAVLVIGG